MEVDEGPAKKVRKQEEEEEEGEEGAGHWGLVGFGGQGKRQARPRRWAGHWRRTLAPVSGFGTKGRGKRRRGLLEADELMRGRRRRLRCDSNSHAILQAKAGITPDIAERLTACSNELSKGRKKRAISPTGKHSAQCNHLQSMSRLKL